MSRKLIIIVGVIAVANTASLLLAQIESTLPPKNAQPREAIQPSTTTSPLLKPKPPLNKTPRLTDGATDEHGDAIEPGTDELTRPTEVLTNRPGGAVLRSRNPDVVMATWIALASHEEIALAELAADRAHNPAVRQFAAAMAKDHVTLLNRLRPYAPEAIRRDYLNLTARDARTQETVIRNRAAANAAPASINIPVANKTPARVGPVIDRLADGKPPEKDLTPSVTRTEQDRPRLGAEPVVVERVEVRPVIAGRDFSVVQVERDLAVQSLASSKELLVNKTGSDFDEWFLAQQIGIHKSLRDKLIIYQRYVSSDLGKVFAEGEAASVAHLAQTNELLSQVSRPVPDAPLPRN
ncbi:MAG: hypothetical protein JWN70_6563 [Planctomycetaceae bacterium]|nr:hypothetical protein [Planctomycetaceae bacterium]